MSTVTQVLKKVNKINNLSLLQKQMADIIINDQLVIEIKEDEFEQGLRPDGSIIGEYAWDSYREFKEQLNPRADGNVDLRLSGSTYQKLFVEKSNQNQLNARQAFLFQSRDSKWRGLVNKYGEDIKGLSKSSFADLQSKEYLAKFITKIKQISGLR